MTTIIDWLGSGLDADLPIAATIDASLVAGAAARYYAYDTGIDYVLNRDTVAWDAIGGNAANTIENLTDVTIDTSLATGDIFRFNGTKWANAPATGTSPAGSSGDIQTNSSGSFGALTPASGIATFLATPTSANLRGALTDETGTGVAVFATSPTLVTPNLGIPSAIDLINATNFPASVHLTVVTKTADYTILSGDTGKDFNNNGALGDVVLSLPSAVPPLIFAVSVHAAHYIKLLADGTDKIAVGPDNSAAGGYVRNNALYNHIEIRCAVAGQWYTSSFVGNWGIDL